MPHWDRQCGPPPTIAQVLEAGDEISVHCWNPKCTREGALDLPALAAKYGRDLDFDRIRAMLRCTECGKKSQPGGYPYGGTHRTIMRLAITKRMTPNLGHLVRDNGGASPEPLRKRRRRKKSDWMVGDEATMCGRFTIKDAPETYRTNLRLLTTPNWPPRYNVCPTQDVPVARPADGGLAVTPMRWGLIPSWVRSKRPGPPLINARSETIEKRQTWRDAFKKRRCLIPADGYYEWTGDRSAKQPWYITLTSGKPFAFAGIWETWSEAPDKEPLLSTAMATTTATESLAFIHERMPVILTDPIEQDAWMNPVTPVDQLKALLRPYPSDAMSAYKVGRAVSNVRNDSPECIEPLEALATGYELKY